MNNKPNQSSDKSKKGKEAKPELTPKQKLELEVKSKLAQAEAVVNSALKTKSEATLTRQTKDKDQAQKTHEKKTKLAKTKETPYFDVYGARATTDSKPPYSVPSKLTQSLKHLRNSIGGYFERATAMVPILGGDAIDNNNKLRRDTQRAKEYAIRISKVEVDIVESLRILFTEELMLPTANVSEDQTKQMDENIQKGLKARSEYDLKKSTSKIEALKIKKEELKKDELKAEIESLTKLLEAQTAITESDTSTKAIKDAAELEITRLKAELKPLKTKKKEISKIEEEIDIEKSKLAALKETKTSDIDSKKALLLKIQTKNKIHKATNPDSAVVQSNLKIFANLGLRIDGPKPEVDMTDPNAYLNLIDMIVNNRGGHNVSQMIDTLQNNAFVGQRLLAQAHTDMNEHNQGNHKRAYTFHSDRHDLRAVFSQLRNIQNLKSMNFEGHEFEEWFKHDLENRQSVDPLNNSAFRQFASDMNVRVLEMEKVLLKTMDNSFVTNFGSTMASSAANYTAINAAAASTFRRLHGYNYSKQRSDGASVTTDSSSNLLKQPTNPIPTFVPEVTNSQSDNKLLNLQPTNESNNNIAKTKVEFIDKYFKGKEGFVIDSVGANSLSSDNRFKSIVALSGPNGRIAINENIYNSPEVAELLDNIFIHISKSTVGNDHYVKIVNGKLVFMDNSGTLDEITSSKLIEDFAKLNTSKLFEQSPTIAQIKDNKPIEKSSDDALIQPPQSQSDSLKKGELTKPEKNELPNEYLNKLFSMYPYLIITPPWQDPKTNDGKFFLRSKDPTLGAFENVEIKGSLKDYIIKLFSESNQINNKINRLDFATFKFITKTIPLLKGPNVGSKLIQLLNGRPNAEISNIDEIKDIFTDQVELVLVSEVLNFCHFFITKSTVQLTVNNIPNRPFGLSKLKIQYPLYQSIQEATTSFEKETEAFKKLLKGVHNTPAAETYAEVESIELNNVDNLIITLKTGEMQIFPVKESAKDLASKLISDYETLKSNSVTQFRFDNGEITEYNP